MLSIIRDLEAVKPEGESETVPRMQDEYGILLLSEGMQVLFLNQRAKVLAVVKTPGNGAGGKFLISSELTALGRLVGQRLGADRAAQVQRQFEVARIIIVGEDSLSVRAIGLPGKEGRQLAKILLLIEELVSPVSSSI